MFRHVLILAVMAVTAGCAGAGDRVGNDRDGHGCIGSAGYTWCEARQKCIRDWEEPCVEGSVISAVYTCSCIEGDVKVDFYKGGFASMEAAGGKYKLEQAISASGARYTGKGIELWDKGGKARLEIGGKACTCNVQPEK